MNSIEKLFGIVVAGLSRVTDATITFTLKNLLGTSSKIEKGRGTGYATKIMYLSPFTRMKGHAKTPEGRNIIRAMARWNLDYWGLPVTGLIDSAIASIDVIIKNWNSCADAARNGCVKSCLAVESGHLRFPELQRYEFIKTLLLATNPDAFYKRLSWEVTRLTRNARNRNLQFACRLNGGSDLDFIEFISAHPDTIFWDYTKNPTRMMRYLSGLLPSNYHLTFSRGSSNWDECRQILKSGGNVAIVLVDPSESRVGTKVRIQNGNGYFMSEVISGDIDDNRFLDDADHKTKHGKIVELIGKGGPINSDRSGFAIRSYSELESVSKGCAIEV